MKEDYCTMAKDKPVAEVGVVGIKDVGVRRAVYPRWCRRVTPWSISLTISTKTYR